MHWLLICASYFLSCAHITPSHMGFKQTKSAYTIWYNPKPYILKHYNQERNTWGRKHQRTELGIMHMRVNHVREGQGAWHVGELEATTDSFKLFHKASWGRSSVCTVFIVARNQSSLQIADNSLPPLSKCITVKIWVMLSSLITAWGHTLLK